MARLPVPGSDNNQWGQLLNDFLQVEHNGDGTLKPGGSLATKADTAYVDNALATTAQQGDLVVSVKDHGALGDGTTDDTAAITAAINAVNAAGGGTVFFPKGTYLTGPQIHYGGMLIKGASRARSIIKLKPGANADLLVTEGFATFSGTSNNGPSSFALESITLDANRTAQTARSRCWTVYGYNYTVRDVWFINGRGSGVYSEWGGPENPMEAIWENVKIWNYGGTPGARGLDWNGPHDSKFTNLIVATLDSTIRPTDVTYGATPINGSAVAFPGPAVPFTFVTTAAAPTSLYPTSGGSFVVPIGNSLNTWTTITYTSAVTVGNSTTFSGCLAPVAVNRSVTANKGIVVPTYGIAVNMGAAGRGESAAVFTGSHIWGRNHFGIFGNTTIYCSNTEAEGSFIASVVLTSGSTYIGGSVYGTHGQTGQENEVGIQLGWDSGGCGHSLINTHVHNVGGSGSLNGSGVFTCNSAGGNMIRVVGTTLNPTRYVSPYNGSPDIWEAYCQNNINLSAFANYENRIIPMFRGGILPGMVSSGGRIYSGSGAPNITTSQAGDYYFRTDTPAVANQRIYVATAVNTWTGIL